MRSLLVAFCCLCLWSVLPATRVAVVDMNAVLDACKEASQRKKSLEALTEKYRITLAKLTKEMEDLGKKRGDKITERGAFEPTRVEAGEITGEITRIEGEIKAIAAQREQLAQRYEAEIEQQTQQLMLQMYGEIREAVAKIADKQGIDIVVRTDAEAKEEKNLRRQLNQAMTSQVLYAGKDLDITRTVIEWLNSNSKK